jgi:signal transduction histidine kinase
MNKSKIIILLIFIGVIIFAVLDSSSSLRNEIETIKREISSRLSNTSKMASFISKMPALTGAIEFQSYTQLDIVIDNIFKEDTSIKRFLVLDKQGNILHSKISAIEEIKKIPHDIIAKSNSFTYFFQEESVFISKEINTEISQESFWIIFQINYRSLLNERLESMSLPNQTLRGVYHEDKKSNLEFLNLNSVNIRKSYLKAYVERNIFRLSSIILILMLITTLIVKMLFSPIRKIIFSLQNISNENYEIINPNSYPRIFRPIIKSIIDANLTIKEASRKQTESNILKERNEAVAKTAAKVAHDIRSPLTSLEFIVSNISPNLSEKERLTANLALERISDILRTLSGKKTSEDQSEAKIEIIDPLVKRILSEKRLEFKSKTNVELRLNNLLPYGVFVKISKADFYRTMSNLINNSAEAFIPDKKLYIDINLLSANGVCVIDIKDNGKGIPKNILDKVIEHGVSYEKDSGSGIGLTSAKETIEKYNGSLVLNSEEGKGTTVTIKLPIVSAPTWFQTILKPMTSNICIIDDDDSIHSIWDEILSGKKLNITHIKSADEFETWIKNVKKDHYTFLFDLELLGSKVNGLELIEKFKLEQRSTLVTSHYDDFDVQTNAQKLGVKIIPKDSASTIMIDLSLVFVKKMVLIEDDQFIHMSWQMAAEKNEIDLSTYFSIDDFLKDADKFPKNTLIYIDSNFNNGIKGEFESKKIFDLGFSNLFLASGMDFEELPYWIQGNQGKSFPVTVMSYSKLHG